MEDYPKKSVAVEIDCILSDGTAGGFFEKDYLKFPHKGILENS